MLKGFTKKHGSYPGESSCDSTVWHWGRKWLFQKPCGGFLGQFSSWTLFSFRTIAQLLLISLQGVLSPLLTRAGGASGLSCLPAVFQVIGQTEEGREKLLFPQKWPIRMHAGSSTRPDWGAGDASAGLTFRASWISSSLVPLHPPPWDNQIAVLGGSAPGLQQHTHTQTHTHTAVGARLASPCAPLLRLFLSH